MKILILSILITMNSFAADKEALRNRNQNLSELYQKSLSTESHNKFFIYKTEVGQPGLINNDGIDFLRENPNIIKIPIPAGLELRSCKTPPQGERVVIQVKPGQDYIEVSTNEMKKLELLCIAQDLTTYSFISYKEEV